VDRLAGGVGGCGEREMSSLGGIQGGGRKWMRLNG
jgi:hypothetical protein